MASFVTGFSSVGDLHWDGDDDQLWVVCGNTCDGRSRVFAIDSTGVFAPVAEFARPTGMPNLNNAGFAMTRVTQCVGGSRPVYWIDAGNTGGHSLRAGTMTCTPPIGRAGWSAPTNAKGDFNDDGFGDLAIAAPGENLRAGAVHVLFGSTTGLTTTGSQFLQQGVAGIADLAETGDEFGRALAVGNFNSDGFNDLAIGAPGENAGAGTVHVLYGSAAGLTATGSQQFTQDSSGVPDNAEVGDHFGAMLAAGNLDTSTVASELVIGAPDEDIGAWVDAGIVHVLKGTSTGLKGTYSQVWSQYSPGIADNPEDYDHFGSSLAIGNLGGSVAADPAIGVPEEDGATTFDYGVVHVLFGSATGLSATGSSLWSQNSTGIGESAETGDGFGAALAIGNVAGNGFGDLIVGVPGEDHTGARDAGLIHMIRGSTGGPTSAGSQILSEATPGVGSSPEIRDQFGYALAVGDFGGDSFLDLAVGAPGQTIINLEAGIVHMIPGSVSGPTAATGSQGWTLHSFGLCCDTGAHFGESLAAGDYGNTPYWDLAIGAPGDWFADRPTGSVHVLPGSAAFLTATGGKTFTQDTAGVAEDREPLDDFGLMLGR